MRRFRFHEQRIIRLGAGVVLFALAGSSYGFGWTLVNAKIPQDFPEVKRITTAELAAWLEDEERVVPLLLDVRTTAEFERSHLRNAQQIAPIAPGPLLQEVKDRPIVTYCSVGYRSAALAERLRAEGYSNVLNLEGSIFRWANEGRPLYRGHQLVREVHPYNATWGLLLRKELRAKVAPANTPKTRP
jgi:rhodanese-related sulfurtransferase